MIVIPSGILGIRMGGFFGVPNILLLAAITAKVSTDSYCDMFPFPDSNRDLPTCPTIPIGTSTYLLLTCFQLYDFTGSREERLTRSMGSGERVGHTARLRLADHL
jgi:hypothetical protein